MVKDDPSMFAIARAALYITACSFQSIEMLELKFWRCSEIFFVEYTPRKWGRSQFSVVVSVPSYFWDVMSATIQYL